MLRCFFVSFLRPGCCVPTSECLADCEGLGASLPVQRSFLQFVQTRQDVGGRNTSGELQCTLLKEAACASFGNSHLAHVCFAQRTIAKLPRFHAKLASCVIERLGPKGSRPRYTSEVGVNSVVLSYVTVEFQSISKYMPLEHVQGFTHRSKLPHTFAFFLIFKLLLAHDLFPDQVVPG